MIGQRVIGNWGAMHAYNYGVIISVNDGWARVQWSDGSFHNTQAVDIASVSREGFLPTGFFPRVLGKCVSWSHSTHGAPVQLSQSHAIVSFGGDRALLSELPEWNCIRVQLLQDNVLAVERTSALVSTVCPEPQMTMSNRR